MSCGCWGRSESFFFLLFSLASLLLRLFFLPACLEIGSETLFERRYKLAGCLLYLVPCHVSMYLSIISIAFNLNHPLLSSRGMGKHPLSLQRFIHHQPARNFLFLFLFLNSTQVKSTRKKRISHSQASRTDIHIKALRYCQVRFYKYV